MFILAAKPRRLKSLDWIIFGVLAAVMVGAGLLAARSSGRNLSSYFLGGRNLPWWMVGISMVATTFAADTPLAVTELVANHGISGNWLWWNLLAGGMLTTFFFANLWRRSGVLTEVELIELRYGGRPAAFLRPFKAIYLGLFMNALVIGWVNLAMITILSGFFGISPETAFRWTAVAMAAVALYCAFSGLIGVVVTDMIQFGIAMAGSIALAYFVLDSPEIGGMTGLKAQLPDSAFSFFPAIGQGGETDVLSITTGAFIAFFGMMWWASWYPGAEPGGGGYIAQRMLSAKNEKHAVYSTLFFQIAHYCLRPWPWIVVGLAALVLFNTPKNIADPALGARYEQLSAEGPVNQWLNDPETTPVEFEASVGLLRSDLNAEAKRNPALKESMAYNKDPRFGYIYALKNHTPTGWMGLLLVGFFAAYMSTISTQLNWGASYLVNDVYHRSMAPGASDATLIHASRLTVILLTVTGLTVSLFIESISGVWQFIMECGAGLGLVLILRWFWWRINAWSEIAATLAPFVGYAVARGWIGLKFPESFFFTVSFTTVAWLVVTFATKPEADPVLQNFFDRIRPDGQWGRFRTVAEGHGRLWRLAICWISAVIMTYSLLFASGKAIFLEWEAAGWYAVTSILAFFVMRYNLERTRILK